MILGTCCVPWCFTRIQTDTIIAFLVTLVILVLSTILGIGGVWRMLSTIGFWVEDTFIWSPLSLLPVSNILSTFPPLAKYLSLNKSSHVQIRLPCTCRGRVAIKGNALKIPTFRKYGWPHYDDGLSEKQNVGVKSVSGETFKRSLLLDTMVAKATQRLTFLFSYTITSCLWTREGLTCVCPALLEDTGELPMAGRPITLHLPPSSSRPERPMHHPLTHVFRGFHVHKMSVP